VSHELERDIHMQYVKARDLVFHERLLVYCAAYKLQCKVLKWLANRCEKPQGVSIGEVVSDKVYLSNFTTPMHLTIGMHPNQAYLFRRVAMHTRGEHPAAEIPIAASRVLLALAVA
jgi:hypothetical protein